jgi:4-alpha-glucanotransferase
MAPLQDVLGLTDAARMNRPGEAEDNWTWRCTSDQLSNEIADRLRGLTEQSRRCPARGSVEIG